MHEISNVVNTDKSFAILNWKNKADFIQVLPVSFAFALTKVVFHFHACISSILTVVSLRMPRGDVTGMQHLNPL